MMGTRNLSLLKTHFDSIKACFVNNFVPGNMLWVVTSILVSICKNVLYSFGLILQFIFRVHKADGKNKFSVQPEEDSQVDGFREEMINFLFQSNEGGEEREMESSALMESVADFAEDGLKESGDEGTESPVSEKSREEEEDKREEEDSSASMNQEREKELDAHTKIDSEFYDSGVKNEKEGAERPVLMEDDFVYENSKKIEEDEQEEKEETGMSALMEDEEMERGKREGEEGETENSALISNKFEYMSGRDIIGLAEEPKPTMTFSFREFFAGPYVSDTEILQKKSEKEKSGGAQSFSEFHPSTNGCQVENPERKPEHEPVSQEESQKEISGLKSEEEKLIRAQSSPEFHPSPNGSQVDISELKSEEEKSVGSQSSPEFHLSPNGSEVEIPELISQHEPVFLEESHKETAQEQSMPCFHVSPNVSETEISETKSEEEESDGSIHEKGMMFHGHSSSDQFSLKSEIFRGRDSSDEDDLDFNDNSYESDSESESSSSSGLVWGNSDQTDDLITYEFLAYQKGFEALEPEALKLMEKLRAIDEFIELAPGKAENEDGKKKLGELGSDDEEEEDDEQDDLEWDDDELVEKMKMEMRNARQGGLPTILEDEEGGQEVNELPKMVEDLKPLKIGEEKLAFKDHIREIQKVHKSYQEKMRKLDILNYQTMHALGLRQLKEPSEKPMISKNLLWSRKDQKKKKKSPEGTLLVGLVEELEVVYVGQLCLSWEILCWEYRKAVALKQYDGEWAHRYNVVAGEFQLFQVLMQRFIENEPFQEGTRLHNYVRNRCVIRNLLQVPAIQDDSMKEKNMMTKDEEEAVSTERLAEIIRESMYIFSKFARADKHDINTSSTTFFKLPHQTRPNHLKDPATSLLLTDIQTHLHKKEKRLKDTVRSGNCIVRKFQKQSEHKVELGLEQMVAQVQLKLISRVLSMPKLSKDQLIWCNDKLNRISFVDTKVHVEPSFLLFPF